MIQTVSQTAEAAITRGFLTEKRIAYPACLGYYIERLSQPNISVRSQHPWALDVTSRTSRQRQDSV